MYRRLLKTIWLLCLLPLYILAIPGLVKFIISIPGFASLFSQKTLSEVKQSLSAIEEEYRKHSDLISIIVPIAYILGIIGIILADTEEPRRESVKEQEYRPMIVEVKDETLVYEEDDTQVYE